MSDVDGYQASTDAMGLSVQAMAGGAGGSAVSGPVTTANGTQPNAVVGGEIVTGDGAAKKKKRELALQAAQNARELIPEIIQASLSGLGHNKAGRVVYTTVSLSSLSLGSIDALSNYIHLQKITLDNNHLTHLKPLTQCNSISYLSVVGNMLTEGIFEDLRNSSNTLEFLDVTSNDLTSLRGLPQFRYIRTLRVDDNNLTKIHTHELCQSFSLSVFSFSNNDVSHIDSDAFAKTPIRSINAGQNKLTDLSAFTPLQSTISTLGMADNNVMHLEAITAMQRLHTVDFTGNNLYDIGEAHNLAQLPLLRTVSLSANPLCTIHDNAQNVPDDDDDASDIVQPDELAPGEEPQTAGTGGGGRGGAPSSSNSLTPTKPAIIGSQGLKSRNLGNREARQEAATTSTKLFVSEDDDVAALSPQEEDKIQFLTADSEAQYRLRVIWRAPNITQLDGQAVLPEELSHAKKLEGGATRDKRTAARSQFITSGGSAAFALRQKTRHQDPPKIGSVR